MNERIILLGSMSHFPVAGVAWQTLHYLVGLQKMGYEVYYVEAHGCAPSKLMQSASDDGAACAASYIEGILRRFGLAGRWAYVSRYPEPRYFGMSESRLAGLYRSAAFIFNLHGGHLPTEELAATRRLVYIGTDPVEIEIEVQQKKKETLDFLSAHCAFFTFGENLGRPGCRVPRPDPFAFRPTRQPVVLDFWEFHGTGAGEVFTTIGNWRQPWRKLTLDGETYPWSKHLEFEKFMGLPRRTPQAFELALSSCPEEDRGRLESNGWRIRDALGVSLDLDAYRRYLGSSRGEFTVAKDQNVRLRSGWFSDRAATYLAAGRPVINQETGFSSVLPVGEGLFAFSTMEDILAAVEAVNADYERHRRAARAVARECFSHEVVLGKLLADLGVSRPAAAPRAQASSPSIPADLGLMPVSRWPTRLPEATLAAAFRLQTPEAEVRPAASGPRCGIIMVTHQGLPYTKMCVASLLAEGWREGDELIIVDNASTDGTREWLQELAFLNPFVRVAGQDRNLGFAAANNLGLALAGGDAVVLLNNDTLVPPGWLARLMRCLADPSVGLAGPVTNRSCNEAQIEIPYRDFSGFLQFAGELAQQNDGTTTGLSMLAMFCLAMRREVFERVGPLDEQFGIGMFEDDDYAQRVREAGYRMVCAEDLLVHHFGQASLGELCATGEYDRLLAANRARYEAKWGRPWKPQPHRTAPAYAALRETMVRAVAPSLPSGATVLVVSKGDEKLLAIPGVTAWHFPRAADGTYPDVYPADSVAAMNHLEALRAQGAGFLLVPQPAFWWLDHYAVFGEYLDRRYRAVVRDPQTCILFDLGGPRAW